MDKEQIEAFRLEFEFQIDKKPSFGKNEIKSLFTICLVNVLLKNTEYDKPQEVIKAK